MAEDDGGTPTGGSAAGRAGPGQQWRGQRLGLPADGPGSMAPFGPRLAAFAVDIVLAGLVAGLFTAPELPRNWSLVVFLAEYLGFVAAFGQTPGMRLVGLRVIRADRPARVATWQAAVRAVLLALLIPALIWDADQRGLQDRLSRTAVIRVDSTG